MQQQQRRQLEQQQWRRQRPGRQLCQTAAAALTPESLFSVATLCALPAYVMMVILPRARLTKCMLGGKLFFPAAAAVYAALLGAWAHLLPPAWQALRSGATAAAAGSLPDVAAFASLFATPAVTVVTWVHLLLLDLFQAR